MPNDRLATRRPLQGTKAISRQTVTITFCVDADYYDEDAEVRACVVEALAPLILPTSQGGQDPLVTIGAVEKVPTRR